MYKKLLHGSCFILLTALLLTGCVSKFDCRGYVQSVLDALYKGTYSEYTTFTDSTTEEARGFYEDYMTMNAEYFYSLLGSEKPSDEVQERTETFFKTLYGNARYTVADGSEKNTVNITVEPIDIFKRYKNELADYRNQFDTRNENYEFSEMSDKEFYDTYVTGAIKLLESHLSDIQYEDAADFTFTIAPDDDGIYTLTDEDLSTLDAKIVDFDDTLE